MITLQFSDTNLPGAWLIRKFTWSEYSHVDIVLPDGRLLGSRIMGGVQIRAPGGFSRVRRLQVNAPDSVVDHAMSQIGKPYDMMALLGFVGRQNWQDDKRWFCSELVAWAFDKAAAPLLRSRRHHRITPRDLMLSPHLLPADEDMEEVETS